jgi:hypothetical protein
MSQYNLIWIFVDGVRRYPSSPEAIEKGDDRGRLRVMDDFAKESVEFLNVVTSAPSTFQSLSAMASGMHSYHINRNFDDFVFDKSAFPSIGQTLCENGYHDYAFLMHPSTREVLQGLFPMIPRRYWPKGLSHAQWWSNREIFRAVEKTLSMGVENPAFFFVDYNCRRDPETTTIVSRTIERFREAGYISENSIMILCSDHGYPDASKDMGPEFHKRARLGHDAVLTDDNIMIPFFLQYPGCPANTKIETTVATIDIFPTIMEILGKATPPGLHGKSLIPLVNGHIEYRQMMEGRFHRCDSRLSCQIGRGTVIRNGRYKYVFYHDGSRGRNEEFFDIRHDEWECNDLIDSQKPHVLMNLNILRGEFLKSEQDAYAAQLNYLFKRFKDNYGEQIKGAEKILITDSCSALFLDILVKIIREVNEHAIISMLFIESEPNDLEGAVVPIDAKVSNWRELSPRTIRTLLAGKSFDILLVPFNTSERRDNTRLVHALKAVKAPCRAFLDYNMRCFTRSISYEWRLFKAAWPFIKHEPILCMRTFLLFLVKVVFRTRIVGWLRSRIDAWLGRVPDWKAFRDKRYTTASSDQRRL